MKRYALCLLILGACAPNETQAPMPSLSFLPPTYIGFDATLIGQTNAVGPSGILTWGSDWSGVCDVANWDEAGDSSESCDSQSYTLFLSCAGEDCTADPAEALTNSGTHMHGVSDVSFSAASAGTFNATATITHSGQVVTQTQTVNVLQPDALVLECLYEPTGEYPGVDCPSGATPYVPGAIYLFYVYAKQGGQMVDVTAELALEGFTVEPGTATPPVHDTMFVNASGPGDYAIHASFGALTADYAITIQ